tara:strand:- start:207 stop:605 length:399 start_codon:yes stop_codon:yes gene_type:complete
MTIRGILIATSVLAVAFSMYERNWGIPAFAIACIPLTLHLSLSEAFGNRHVLRSLSLALSVLLVYIFSVAPCMTVVSFCFGWNDRPPIVEKLIGVLYGPIWFALDVMRENAAHASPIQPMLHFFDGYFNEWS